MDLRKLDRVPSVAAVMTPFPYSVQVDDPVGKAEALMEEHGIRHVPVQDERELVGVLAQRDIALLLGSGGAERPSESVAVRQVYVKDAYVVDLREPLDRVVLEMAERHIGSALVVRNGRLAGIFTATDACRVLGEFLRERFPPTDGGEAA